MPSSLESLHARILLSILAFAIGQSAISIASTPAYLYLAAPSIKKSISGSIGGSSSTTNTFLPAFNFFAKEFFPLSIARFSFKASVSLLSETSVTLSKVLETIGIFSILSQICLISLGVVPQQPPIISVPSCKSS